MKHIKICLLSYSDGGGGAFIGAYRLHEGLKKVGADSKMIVNRKVTDDASILAPPKSLGKIWAKLAPRIDAIPLNFYRNRGRNFSLQWLPDGMTSQVNQLNPDVIYLHWIGYAFMQIETLRKLNKPLVWKLADMWAFSGGCHYSQECNGYTQSCGSCPQLNSNKEFDLSRWVWKRKAKAWKNLDLTLVTPSRWLAKCASESSLFRERRIEVIPNGIDTQIYKPIERSQVRHILNLPQEKQLILFVARNVTSDRRKGFHLLLQALELLERSENNAEVELVVVGASKSKNFPDLNLKRHYLGQLNDEISLALAYSAADVFIAPSTQDNFPNTVMEALACGTPCVAFNIGGMPDLIEHHKNGYLAQPFEVEDLTQGIIWILENQERCNKLSAYARRKVEKEFNIELQVKRYLSLFEEVSKNK